jgi:hypothetical protein
LNAGKTVFSITLSMPKTELHIDFKTLRQSYLEVKTFIERESGATIESIHTKIEDDLGCTGDDNLEILEKFVAKYKLDTSDFDYSRHFLSEGELFNSGTALLGLIVLPISISLGLLRLLSFGRFDYTNRQLLPDYYRPTTDMTFGDMLTWYLTGKYNLRENVRVVLKPIG